ncbi:MAG: copper chaperone PCu(A)C [Gammaproteobacteria bacterium]|nr:copper chaperone PCu(A)C [Gammaproteobacteria bacterium]MBU1775065.1 copper chaperone PCu(A)C [Gammaproteobacteria bacterium]MBU1968529.1 copper chaperone PCu(A)C [Gammaproteobacteria bacterium]
MWRKLICTASLVLAGNVWAGANDVIVDKVWMRESVPGQTSSTVQLNLSVTKAARLLSVSSPVAAAGEIQGVVMRKGKMQTATVNSMQLRAHSTTLFGSRGTYLTLVGLKQPLVVGERIPITLVVEVAGKKQTVNTEALVKALELSYQHYNNPSVKDHR